MLIAARALQGIGGALVSPAALSLLIAIFAEGPERNRALGVWSALAASGGAVGLLLGGVLTDLASWRWVFLVNVFVGIVVVVVSVWILPKSQQRAKGRIDIAGAVTVTLGLIALVYGLERVGQKGLSDGGVLALLAISLVLLSAFVIIELRVKEPLVPFALFRLPTLTGANGATLLLSAIVLGANYFLTLYFQQVQSYSPLLTGCAFLPMTIVSALASGVASRLVNRWSTRLLLLIGMLALAAGSLVLSQITPQSPYLGLVLLGLCLVAIGLGFGFTLGTLAATAGVPAKQQGIASGILSTSQQIGGALGLAVLTTVASIVTRGATGSASLALTSGFSVAFLIMSGLGLVAALVVLVLVRQPDCQKELQRRHQEEREVLTCTAGHSSACQPAVTHLAGTSSVSSS